MSQKTVQLDGMNIRVEKGEDGITAEPVAPQNMEELVETVHEATPDKIAVRHSNGLVKVEGSPMYTRTLLNIKDLGLSLSYIGDDEAVFVHDEFGNTRYSYAYGADGSDQ